MNPPNKKEKNSKIVDVLIISSMFIYRERNYYSIKLVMLVEREG
jgi:hypothetical protein